METKALTLTVALVALICSTALCQREFDDKLRSLYKNTVPLIQSDVLVQEMTAQQTIILDTRSEKEFDISHLPGAIFLDYDSFKPERVSNIDKDSRVVVYCSVGYRSERIGEQLIKLGFTDVSNLYGGIFDWINRGNPVVNVSGVATDSVHTYNRDWSKWVIRGVKVY